MTERNVLSLRTISVAILIALASASALPLIGRAGSGPPACSSTYIVRSGDTWSTVSRATGVKAAELRKANPKAVRPNDWLWIGDRLCIPGQAATAGYWREVQRGDTWNTVSRATGVGVRELWAANPGLLDDRFWLYVGQRVWIPDSRTAKPTATSTPGAQVLPTAAATRTPSASLTPIPTATGGESAGCPASLGQYPQAILIYLNTLGNAPGSLNAWLSSCGAVEPESEAVIEADLQSPGSADLAVTLRDPVGRQLAAGMLLVYHNSPQGFTLVHKAESAGAIALLHAGDLNLDNRPEIAWTDTTCGAHTCFSTLSVDSWDGAAYQDWIEGEPTMASAQYRFDDTETEGSGSEIIVHGGVIGSAGAGPQRAWTETFTSAGGAPYSLFTQAFDSSDCLYHNVLDANAAFGRWTTEGFEPAIAAYQAVIDDVAAETCGSIPDELATLRDFARFRLMLSYVAAGQADEADTVMTAITDAALLGAAQTFDDAYEMSGSIVQACRETTAYADATPDAWQFLADWGYANPTFAAEDLCPLS